MRRARMWMLAAAVAAVGFALSPEAGVASVPAAPAEVAPKQAPKRPAPKVVQITIDKATFGEAPAGIVAGDTIEWVNRDIFDHTATARTKVWDVVIPAGKKARVVMKKAGTFEYYCTYHPNMVATLAVKK